MPPKFSMQSQISPLRDGLIAGFCALSVSIFCIWSQAGPGLETVIALGLSALAGVWLARWRKQEQVKEREQQQTELALRQSESQYRSVVNNLKEVVFQTDIEGRWSFLNPS